MMRVHRNTAIIAIIFAIISIILLILLEVEGIFLVIIMWMLVPVFIKKIIDRLRKPPAQL